MNNTSVGRLWAQGTSATIAEEEEKKRKKQLAEEKTLANSNTPVAGGSSKAINNYKQQVLNGIGQQGQSPNAQSVGGINELG